MARLEEVVNWRVELVRRPCVLRLIGELEPGADAQEAWAGEVDDYESGQECADAIKHDSVTRAQGECSSDRRGREWTG